MVNTERLFKIDEVLATLENERMRLIQFKQQGLSSWELAKDLDTLNSNIKRYKAKRDEVLSM